MTIKQVVQLLYDEQKKQLTSRFPCRAIMVRNINQYCTLLDELRRISDISFVESSLLFADKDVMPCYNNLTAREYSSQWVVLTGVSEYLRLFSKGEAETQRFAKLWKHHSAASNTGRIIIPMWGCEAQWHDQSLHFMDDLRQQEFYYSCMDSEDTEQRLKITVLSDSFGKQIEQAINNNCPTIHGLQELYDYWAEPSSSTEELLVVTARIRDIVSVNGAITISVVRDTLAFLQTNIKNGSILTPENCPEEAQSCILQSIRQNCTVEEMILTCLNVGTFSPVDIMGRWNVLTTGQKQLVKLWYHIKSDDSYLSYCILKSKNISELETHIAHDIFALQKKDDSWLSESQQLISAMRIERDEEFYLALDQIPEFDKRLCFLSGSSPKERSYIIKMVGKWLLDDLDSVLQSEKLKEIYPALYVYLDSGAYDEDLNRYMLLYKTYKLSNTLPEDEHVYFADFDIERYDLRYPVLADFVTEQTVVLWIDALGVEWLPLLLWSLRQSSSGTVIDAKIGMANLPTETEFNDQWKQMEVPYKKLDLLDKLAHKGVIDDPSYYACVEEQLGFMTNIRNTIETMLKDYQRVIVTGDHGTSRLAARFFHKREGVPIQKGGKVKSHGRYGFVLSDPDFLPSTQRSTKDADGNHYIVFNNYDHFTQSGFAAGAEDEFAIYGEVHGGATPEEALIPIVVIDSNRPLALTAKWKENPVKIARRKVKSYLCFNQSIKSIQANIGDISASVCPVDNGKEWILEFAGIPAGIHQVSVVADGKLVALSTLEVLPGLSAGQGDLP